MKERIHSEPYGVLPDGQEVRLYSIFNDQGMKVEVINYGGIITSIYVPDRHGNKSNVVLGLDSLSQYLRGHPFLGALVGRYANRISGGKFNLFGDTIQLTQNSGENQIHGGYKGFDKVYWVIEEMESEDGVGLQLRYNSPDGEEGFPGNLSTTVIYFLGNDNSFSIEYTATTDQTTIVNLTQHSYFNLSGSGDILDHEMTISASRYLPIDVRQLPTGEVNEVTATPFDFRNKKAIGQDIEADHVQLERGKGYDHFWLFDEHSPSTEPFHAAQLYDPKSGRKMDVWTTDPGAQIYTGNFLDGSLTGNQGHKLTRRSGVCIETGQYPDAPNHDLFPEAMLIPGDRYYAKTIFKFSAD